jgi:putative flippase GtrA
VEAHHDERGKLRMAMALTADGSLTARIRRVMPELIKFGVVGGLGSVIDLGGAAVLNSDHASPITAKAISVTAATVFTYLGSRFWTFRHRENQASVTREAVLFIVLNVVGLIIAEAVIGIVTYVMGLRGTLEYNAASVIGTGLGTIFRFYAYRKWVFTAPGDGSGARGAMSRVPDFPDYPPWEVNQAYAPAYAAAPVHEAPHGANRYEPAPYLYDPAPYQYQAAQQEYAAAQQGGPGPQYGGPQYGGPQHAGPQYGGPQHAGPQYPGPQYGGPQHPAPQYAGPQYGGPQHPAPQYAGAQPQYAGAQWENPPVRGEHGAAQPALTGPPPTLPHRPVPSAPRGGGKHRRR